MKGLLNKDMNTDILEQELLQLKACLREDYPIKYTEYELKHIKEEIKDLENELKEKKDDLILRDLVFKSKVSSETKQAVQSLKNHKDPERAKQYEVYKNVYENLVKL